jgi:hypothetical protein
LKLIDFLAQTTKFNPDDDEVESLFSLTDEITPDTIAAVADESSDDEIYELYQAQPTLTPSHPIPLAPVSIFTSTYAKPIKAIALFDTGAHRTIFNPKVLPPHCWVTHREYFRAADNQVFCTQYKTKRPITIQILPQCSVKTYVLGSPLPGKDLVIGFDVYFKSKFKILPRGIQYKTHFLPYTLTPSLYEIQSSSTDHIALIKAQIIQHSCSNSHQEFLAKCSHPLWQNPQFFIKLPFKLNEDINPTKASHSGMNPEHKLLAQEECAHLQAQGLIEPTNSPWSCEAFYVNKRSEQKRGKLWLVINYQPLNHFLQDDKFPLPNTMTLFSCLHNAKVFSKFDLKAGFWQLDIHPEDRYKTGFCIPDHHYQWRVMSFGLKVAPSLFQKAMIKVFEPMLPSALVYIDDVLLFSKDEESHATLLQQFAELVHQHGIMLLCYNNLPSLSTNMASCFLKARCSSVKRKLNFLAWFLRMVLIHLAPISLKNFKSFQMAPSRESKSNNFWALSNISEILFLELHR